MWRARMYRGCVAWLVVLALVGNLLAGILSPSTAKGATLIDDVLGALVICNGAGGTADHGNGGERPSSEHCKLCPLLAGFALLATLALILFAFPVPVAFKPPTSFARTLPDHLSLGCVYSRGPPLSAA
jgi:Protein of unknown function (DUF2946)